MTCQAKQRQPGILWSATGVMRLAVALLFAAALLHGNRSAGQPLQTEVPLKVLGAEIVRFERPIVLRVGKRVVEYREAMVLALEVERKDLDALPPSLEPFLYIGQREYRIFKVEPGESRETLRLEVHITDWGQLQERAPIVLTIDHGAPRREPQRFLRPEVPRFDKALIVDKR